jgi:hypothetical protein
MSRDECFFGTIRRLEGPIEIGSTGARGMALDVGVGPDGGEETRMESLVTIDSYIPLDLSGSKIRVETNTGNAGVRANLGEDPMKRIPLRVKDSVKMGYFAQVFEGPRAGESFYVYRLK